MFHPATRLRNLFRRPAEADPLKRAIEEEIDSIQRHQALRRARRRPTIPE